MIFSYALLSGLVSVAEKASLNLTWPSQILFKHGSLTSYYTVQPFLYFYNYYKKTGLATCNKKQGSKDQFPAFQDSQMRFLPFFTHSLH